MVDRRELLLAALGACAYGAVSRAGLVPNPAVQLERLLDDFMQENLRSSPELATTLGLDGNTGAKSRLDDRSLQGLNASKQRIAEQLRRLSAMDRQELGPRDAVNYDSVRFSLAAQDDANRRFEFGDVGARIFWTRNTRPANAGTPYVVSQVSGAYSVVFV
jgi:uncharacterized protein (DUF885 family)